MLYSGESKKAIVSIKPSENVSDIWLHMKKRVHVLFFGDVWYNNNAGLTPG